MRWLREDDSMGIPGWLWLLWWASLAFLAPTLAVTPLAMLLGW